VRAAIYRWLLFACEEVKMGKRSNGEGTIYRRKNGDWCGQCSLILNGKTHRKTVYGKTQKIVKDKLKAILNDSEQEQITDSSYTLEEWIYQWLYEYKQKNLKVTTFQNYLLNIDTHVKGTTIGSMKIGELTTNHLQKFYNELGVSGRKDGKGGLSPRMIRYLHILISGALEQAVKNDMISKNVSKATVLPQKSYYEIVPLSVDEVKEFLTVCKEDRLYCLYLLEIYTGLRRGEILGLEWRDIDFAEKRLYVRRTLVQVKNDDDLCTTKMKLTVQEPKTAKSKRVLPINDTVIEELILHRERQNKEKEYYADIYLDKGLVFSRVDGDYLRPREFLRDFQKLLTKAGIEKKRFHDLRHTFASILLNENENPKVIQELLGHSTITTTLDIYSHVLNDTKVKSVKKLEDRLNN
jgi:integrase